jgi:hypothetical protein
MKQTLFVGLLLSFAITALCQPTNTPVSPVQTDYLKKSKHQKTVAWILLGGGAVFATTGLAIGINSALNEFGTIITTGHEDKSFVAGEVLFYTGIVSMLGSIPLFIISSRNKRRANTSSAFFKMEPIPVMQQTSFISRRYPAISLKISL